MSRFATDWLALREPADAGARAARLAALVAELEHGARVTHCIDLGAGTGAALRYLAPRLGGAQHWQLADADPVALGAARRVLGAWATARGATVTTTREGMTLADAEFDCRVRLVETDVATGLDALDWTDGALVSASALLDLVSADWIERLVAACVAGRNPAWLTLTVDGRIELEPRDALDDRVLAAFGRDQRRDKGFGPALGPDAAAHARAAFAAAGFTVASETSDWVIGADATRPLAAALLESYADLARTLEPPARDSIEAWRRRRAAQLADGALTLRVGHVDLLAVPGRARPDAGRAHA